LPPDPEVITIRDDDSKARPQSSTNTTARENARAAVVADGLPEAAQQFDAAVDAQKLLRLGVPLWGPNGFATWALMDLILTLCAVLLALLCLARALRKRVRTDDDDGFAATAGAGRDGFATATGGGGFVSATGDGGFASTAGGGELADTKAGSIQERFVRRPMLVAVLLLALASAVIFLLTQDLSLPVVLLDYWTLLLLALFLAQIVCARRAFVRRDSASRATTQSYAKPV
jgi:hypothetical protein